MNPSSTIGLVYGSDTGNTEEAGHRIAEVLQGHGLDVEVMNVTEASAPVLAGFDFLIMGIPTWDFGGLQQDWEEFEQELASAALAGKPVALFGLGDQAGYGEYFLDALGWLHDRLLEAGAIVLGQWPVAGYRFEASRALTADGTCFVGLALDEDNQSELSDERIALWVDQLLDEYRQALAA